MNASNINPKHYAEFHYNTECLHDVIVKQLIADVPLEPFEKYIDNIMSILEPALASAANYTHQLWQDAQEAYTTQKFNSEHTPLTPKHFPSHPSPSPQPEETSDFS